MLQTNVFRIITLVVVTEVRSSVIFVILNFVNKIVFLLGIMVKPHSMNSWFKVMSFIIFAIVSNLILFVWHIFQLFGPTLLICTLIWRLTIFFKRLISFLTIIFCTWLRFPNTWRHKFNFKLKESHSYSRRLPELLQITSYSHSKHWAEITLCQHVFTPSQRYVFIKQSDSPCPLQFRVDCYLCKNSLQF